MRLREILPITEWLGSYSPARLGPDGVAGLSLAAFVIPELLAYASLAGLPPVSGLYCYLAAGLAYAVFGTSRQLAVGPTSALALAVAAGIAALDGGDPARAAALAAAIALMVGVIAIGGRFLGLANLAYFFPIRSSRVSRRRGSLHRLHAIAEASRSRRGQRQFLRAPAPCRGPCCPTPRFRRSSSACWRLRFSCCWNGLCPGGRPPWSSSRPRSRRPASSAWAGSVSGWSATCRKACRPLASRRCRWPSSGSGSHGVCLFPARLQRGHFSGPQLRPKAGLRDRPSAGTHRPRRVQRRRVPVRGFPVSGGMSQTAVNDMNGPRRRSPSS